MAFLINLLVAAIVGLVVKVILEYFDLDSRLAVLLAILVAVLVFFSDPAAQF